MKCNIREDVLKVISEFVSSQQSFISLDVYCKLGQHFDPEDEVPIHEQVRAAYGSNLMPNYLCKWVRLNLEGGAYANCWKYYVPKADIQNFEIGVSKDGSLALNKEVLGPFALLQCTLHVFIEKDKIVCQLSDFGAGKFVFSQKIMDSLIIEKSYLDRIGLKSNQKVKITTYPNRITIEAVGA